MPVRARRELYTPTTSTTNAERLEIEQVTASRLRTLCIGTTSTADLLAKGLSVPSLGSLIGDTLSEERSLL